VVIAGLITTEGPSMGLFPIGVIAGYFSGSEQAFE
jgi:hypothetical protein